MKRTYRILFGIGITAVLGVLILFGLQRYKKSKISYNFNRDIVKDVVKSINPIDVKFNSYYIAGYSGKDVYLGNYSAGRHALKINPLTADTQSIKIQTDKKDYKLNGVYKLYVNDDAFCMSNGVDRSVLTGNLKTWNAKKTFIYIPYFTENVPVSNHSIVFRSIGFKSNENYLRKQTGMDKTIENDKILIKQIDGIFCTDGKLSFNKELNILLYVYSYRNEILIIDTNLKVVKKINTIDPIDTAKIKIDKIRSNKSTTFSAPPILVNASYSIWNRYIFIHSKIMARNEDEAFFHDSSVIDIYNLSNGKYLYSFYIPSYNYKPISGFQVFDNYLITLSDKYIIKYDIKLPKLL